ncbi:MAG: hypothetical protein KGH98_01675 [Candidatus Micrarchaeota archaeon]|nr:hypothetical protein [Candidatus Micrarchaeota archaeon]
MIFLYLLLLSVGIFSIGIAGMVASRHFLLIMVSAEIALLSSTLLATGVFSLVAQSAIIPFLFAVWAIAVSEVIVIVAVYRLLAKPGNGMDIRALSKLRDER